jgi:chromosome segregation ATPase
LPKITTPVELTELKPETETPDDLSAALNKTSDAYAAITAQIADLQATMRNRRERLDELEVLVLEKSRLVAHLREQVSEAETKLGYARTLAGISKGTVTEKSTANNVKTLTAAVAVLHQQLQEAHLQYSTQDTQARVETSTINKELEQDQAELETLERTRSELKQLKAEKKAELGQAIYAATAYEMRGLLEAERKHEEALAEHRAERLAQQESIAERLADWPQLASRLEEELMPLNEKRAPEPSPSVRLTKPFMEFLKRYVECGPQLEIPQQSTPMQVFQLFLFPDQLAKLLASTQGRVHLEQRLEALRTYLWQVETMERDRATYRELGLYNKSR